MIPEVVRRFKSGGDGVCLCCVIAVLRQYFHDHFRIIEIPFYKIVLIQVGQQNIGIKWKSQLEISVLLP